MQNKNVYMGMQSTAKIPTKGPVDTDLEVLLNMQATAYDAINGRMLTRTPGRFDAASKKEINGRFSVMRLLCRKYAPEKLRVVDELQRIVFLNLEGKIPDSTATRKIKDVCIRHGLNPSMADQVIVQVDMAEMQHKQHKTGSMDMFSIFKQKPQKPTQQSKQQIKREVINPLNSFMKNMMNMEQKQQQNHPMNIFQQRQHQRPEQHKKTSLQNMADNMDMMDKQRMKRRR